MLRARAFLMVLAVLAFVGPVWGAPVEWIVENGGNGHFYEIVSPPGGITWTDAKVEAENSSYLGTPGHLVTVTSQAEWDFVHGAFQEGYTWIGLTDQQQEGVFEWVTLEPFGFAAWKPGEPNNAGDEDYVHYDSVGWNDFHNWKTVYTGDYPHHYVVEYPVPEPSTLILLSMGAVGLLSYAWRKGRRF